MRARHAEVRNAGARAFRGAAIAAAASLVAACGRAPQPPQPAESAAARPAAGDADRDAQRAKELESEAARLDADADSRLHAGDLAFLAGDVSGGRDNYIAAGRLYESAAEQRRIASDLARGVREIWNEESHRRVASRGGDKGR